MNADAYGLQSVRRKGYVYIIWYVAFLPESLLGSILRSAAQRTQNISNGKDEAAKSPQFDQFGSSMCMKNLVIIRMHRKPIPGAKLLFLENPGLLM